MKSFYFGDSPEMSNELLSLVINGDKTATSWAEVHGDYGIIVGEKMIITDYNKKPRVIIETTGIELRRFDEVDEEFAKDEGEGDLSLSYWKKEHREYFMRENTFNNDMKVYCQKFRVVKVMD